MGTDTRKLVVYAALAVLTLWPPVHMMLVKHYQMSPWKLAGWGMYAEPRFGTLGMEVYTRDDGSDRFEQLVAPAPALRADATRFLERRRWLRGLASPDRFARRIFTLHPSVAELRVEIFRPVLERTGGMVVMTSRRYEFQR